MTDTSLSATLVLRRFKIAQKSFVRVKRLPLYVFLKELILNPRNIGAACPSSKKLAKRIASFVPLANDGYVVELGAGTGVVTAALLEHGIHPNRLIAVEKSKHLVELLRKKFPQITIIHGDAAALSSLLLTTLNFNILPITTIVSSLPLRSLPQHVVKQISQQIEQIITLNGRLIQFTYDIRPSKSPSFHMLTNSQSKMVWRNLPPARIHFYQKTTSTML
ncbi:MAG: class I SAM-dependent methyltransferase [bacterium]